VVKEKRAPFTIMGHNHTNRSKRNISTLRGKVVFLIFPGEQGVNDINLKRGHQLHYEERYTGKGEQCYLSKSKPLRGRKAHAWSKKSSRRGKENEGHKERLPRSR